MGALPPFRANERLSLAADRKLRGEDALRSNLFYLFNLNIRAEKLTFYVEPEKRSEKKSVWFYFEKLSPQLFFDNYKLISSLKKNKT